MLARYESGMSEGVTVLMYHRVLEEREAVEAPIPSIVMPVPWFRQHVQWLAANTRVLTVTEALERDSSRSRSGKPLVCLTFDDGYRDNFELAAPILEEHGVRGTFFVTVGHVMDRTPLWYDRAIRLFDHFGGQELRRSVKSSDDSPVPRLGDRREWINWLKDGPHAHRLRVLDALQDDADVSADAVDCQLMTIEQVIELATRGHEIGSHTLTHPILTQLDDDELECEIGASRREFASTTGLDIDGFCYPNGDHDDRIVMAVRQAGYRYACGVQPGRNLQEEDRYRLKRIDITRTRVGNAAGAPSVTSFRSEICLLRERIRALLGR